MARFRFSVPLDEVDGGKGAASSVIEILFTLKGRKSARGIYVEAGTGERGDL